MQIEKTNAEGELLTIDELCQRLKVKQSFLYAPVRRKGKNPIPCIRVGKYLRYNLAEVMAWIKKQDGQAQ